MLGLNRCAVVGVGSTQYGKFPDRSLKDLGSEAVADALADAELAPADIEMAFVASTVHGVTTRQVAVVGQVVMSASGISGIPVYNVENACAGSSTALSLATYAIRSGAVETVLVVGVEKLHSDDRSKTYRGLNGAADIDWVDETGVDVERESVFVAHVYDARLREYMDRASLDAATLAQIAVKNRRHAEHNERAQYRTLLSVEEVLAARTVVEPITTLMCSPIADGASAVILAGGAQARRNDRAVFVRGTATSMGSARRQAQSTIERVSRIAFEQARIDPADIDLAEVHDATAFGELLAYEELGLCAPGEGSSLVHEGATSIGGRIPVNPSGGLESRGHPLAATGAAQILELTVQLRGEGGPRQVKGARIGVAETAGGFVGGDSAAVAVTVLGTSPTED